MRCSAVGRVQVLVLVAVGGVVGCKATPTPVDPVELTVEVLSTGPPVSRCQTLAQIPVEVAVPEAFAGSPARFEVDGEAVWTGTAAATFTIEVDWPVTIGVVQGDLVVTDGGSEQSVAVNAPFETVAGEAPTIQVFGPATFPEVPSVVLDAAAIDEASDASPWVDAIAADDWPALLGSWTAAPDAAVQMLRCPVDAPCSMLEVTIEPTGVGTVATAPFGEARCADVDARSDVSRDLYELTVEDACGSTSRSVEVRFVVDDCDGDGVPSEHDCADERAGVAATGDVAVGGAQFDTLEQAVTFVPPGGTITLCDGVYGGGITLSGDATVLGIGAETRIVPGVFANDEPTLTVSGGAVTLAGLSVVGLDRTGVSGSGGAIEAVDASALTLEDVTVTGGAAVSGGCVHGPASGDFTMRGGRVHTCDATQDGGLLRLYGGELTDVVLEQGSAVRGAGVFSDGPVVLVDVRLEDLSADAGAGLFLDGAEGTVAGCDFVGLDALDGAGIRAELDAGQVLDLRPSTVDLSLTGFADSLATTGAGVSVAGGRLETVLTTWDGLTADVGAGVFASDTVWEDSEGAFTDVEALDGAAAAVDGGSFVGVGPTVTDAVATRGAVFVTGDAQVDLQAGSVDATGCGVWIEIGTVQTAQMTGAAAPAAVCGAGFESDWASSCTELGCD